MKSTISTFYTSFQNRDADAMVACYHDEIIFEDPAFGVLKGERAKTMWRMLCESQKGKAFKLEFSGIQVEGNSGFALWEAQYTFSKTGRHVHNKIDAKFQFEDGLIIKHDDRFNLHEWAKQALGFQGWLLGGTGFFQKKLQQQTNEMLRKYIEKNDLA